MFAGFMNSTNQQ